MDSNFTVIFDACVLYPAPLRDLLMRLAMTGMFRAKWSADIHNEWIHNLLEKRKDLSLTDLQRTRHLMDSHVKDSLVCDYEHLIPSIQLPDKNDRHVVAAALKSNAELIVTVNLKDFPRKAISQYSLFAKHPDEFIIELVDLDEVKVCEAAKKQRAALKNPPISVENFLETLLKQGLTETVSFLREWKNFL